MSDPEQYRQLAAAARRQLVDKPWAQVHLRTCAGYWDDRAARAEQHHPTTDPEGRP